ncbi:transposase [Amphibacillus indicireducens]|uniref:Transposase n=1 Tax=Amphibacillus indicireducens TaxID=1076330 RepID=A0ABP7VPQ3_9BACI
MTKGKRRQYTTEQKSNIIKRMMPPNNESVVIISREERIPEATLYKWRKDARIAGSPTPGNGQTSDKWCSQDKFLVVMETFSMNEFDLAEYCRKKGLYRAQIIAWREVCLQANGQSFNQTKQLNSELKNERNRAKELERDLQKKEKALAEAAALLLLRKKAQAIWGEDEDV